MTNRLLDRFSSARARRKKERTTRKSKRTRVRDERQAKRLKSRQLFGKKVQARISKAETTRKNVFAKIKSLPQKVYEKTPLGKLQKMGKPAKIILFGGIALVGVLVITQYFKMQQETIKAIAPAIVPIASKVATGGIL